MGLAIETGATPWPLVGTLQTVGATYTAVGTLDLAMHSDWLVEVLAIGVEASGFTRAMFLRRVAATRGAGTSSIVQYVDAPLSRRSSGAGTADVRITAAGVGVLIEVRGTLADTWDWAVHFRSIGGGY